jgi:hypothetical protein
MKGISGKRQPMSHTAYAGGNSKVASEAMDSTDGFKKGGKAMGKGMGKPMGKPMGGSMDYAGGYKHGGKSMGKAEGVMSKAHAGRKPRKSGGGVMSMAAGSGTPRGKASNC